MEMKVYILWKSHYEDEGYKLEGIYSSEEKAIIASEIIGEWMDTWIEEREVE